MGLYNPPLIRAEDDTFEESHCVNLAQLSLHVLV